MLMVTTTMRMFYRLKTKYKCIILFCCLISDHGMVYLTRILTFKVARLHLHVFFFHNTQGIKFSKDITLKTLNKVCWTCKPQQVLGELLSYTRHRRDQWKGPERIKKWRPKTDNQLQSHELNYFGVIYTPNWRIISQKTCCLMAIL